MRRLLSSLGLVIAIAGPTPASAQKLSWNPAVTTAVVYDTNVLSSPGEGRADWLGTLILNLPIGYRPTPRVSLDASFMNVSESYRTYPELDDWQARSAASAGLTLSPRQRTRLRFGGSYSQTNRPGDVFTDTGLELGRQPSSSYGGNAGLSQGLGARTDLDMGYSYRYREAGTVVDQYQSANARLGRKFGNRTGLGVSWRYERRYSETRDSYEANIFMADWDQRLSQHFSFSVSGGTRLSEGLDPHPEVRATVSWGRRGWKVGARYSHSVAYTPWVATDLEGRLGTSDSAGLTVSYQARRLRLSAGPSYYWTRNDSLDTRVWRANAQMNFILLAWLSFDATYSYVDQDGIVGSGGEPVDGYRTRHVGRVGLTIAPWNRGGAGGLP